MKVQSWKKLDDQTLTNQAGDVDHKASALANLKNVPQRFLDIFRADKAEKTAKKWADKQNDPSNPIGSLFGGIIAGVIGLYVGYAKDVLDPVLFPVYMAADVGQAAVHGVIAAAQGIKAGFSKN